MKPASAGARGGSRLERLPLRLRLLLAPLLGLALIVVVSAALLYEARRQQEVAVAVAMGDLRRLDRLAGLFVNLSEQHTAIFDLLAQNAVDEATLYNGAMRHLDRVRAATADLQRELEAQGEGAEDVESTALRRRLLRSAGGYREAALSAVDLATVDKGLAGKSLALANEHFVAMNRAFTALLDANRREIDAEFSAGSARGARNTAIIMAAGLLLALVLAGVALAFARRLTRSLEGQVDVLAGLGKAAGAQIRVAAGGDEIARIAGAIEVFRGSLLQLKDQERALSEANRDLTSARDHLEQRVLERTRELSEVNAELRVFGEVVRSTGEAVAITDLEGVIVDVNLAFERITGHARAEVVGTRLYGGAPDLSGDEAHRELWQRVRAEGAWNGELLDRKKDGEVFPWWVTLNAVRDESGAAVRLVSVMRDVTELKRSEQQLQKLAFYDPLTGLANRALLDDRLRMALTSAKRAEKMLAVVYIDLDRFKYVNDTLGHPAGDQLLIEIARRLSELLRASDTVARMGGDEFTLVLTDVRSENDAVRVAERVIDAVSKPVKLGSETVFVGASVGISFFPRDGAEADVLRKHADLALYESKEAGRGQYRVFDMAMLAKAGERVSLAARIELALQNSEFSLVYQPVVNIRSGAMDAVEALIRWHRPDGRAIPPATFIPHAEEIGLIKRIDAWVLETACREVSDWTAPGGAPRLCVNVSAVTLQQPDIAKQVAAILAATGFDSQRLTLELTETAAIANRRVMRETLQQIAALGVRISLDDFGTGYSSLNHLAGFPIDCFKLDQSFVHRIGKDDTSEEIIRSLLQLAANLGLKVVAEGVENEAQQAFLEESGCDMAQGFRYLRPAPAKEVRRLLADAQPALAAGASQARRRGAGGAAARNDAPDRGG